MNAACNFLLDWEADVFCVHPPEQLEPVRTALLGSMVDVLEELEKLPGHLAEAVKRGREHTGPEPLIYNAALQLRFTHEQQISDALEKVKRKAPWPE